MADCCATELPSELARGLDRGQARSRGCSQDDRDNTNTGMRARSTDTANRSAFLPCNTNDSSPLRPSRHSGNRDSIKSTCSSVHVPFVASSKASSIISQRMLMHQGRFTPQQVSYERVASSKVLVSPYQGLKTSASRTMGWRPEDGASIDDAGRLQSSVGSAIWEAP